MGANFARPALSASDFVIFRQIQHVQFKPLVVPITFAAALGGLFWIWSLRRNPGRAEFWLAVAGTAAMVSVAVITRAVNFPINDVGVWPPQTRGQSCSIQARMRSSSRSRRAWSVAAVRSPSRAGVD
jgi:hypothetical protein